MAIKMPDSMDECLYFTRRTLDNDGKIIAWCEKNVCPKCGKAKMGKPVNEKKGTVKIRANEYVCPKCGYIEEKKEHEASCELKVIYTCPHCKKEGDIAIPYVRKKFEGVDAFVFECGSCGGKIGITKKMKKPKKKK